MNKSQKTVILIGMVIAILMILFPPWNRMNSFTGSESFDGYRFIVNNFSRLQVNLPLLAMQEVILLFVVIGLVLVLKDD